MSTDYAALDDTIKFEDITSNKQNQIILQQLRNNEISLDELYIINASEYAQDDNEYEYNPKEGKDMWWLGHYIGQNTKLLRLHFYITVVNESFYKEISHNKSIKEIHFHGCITLDGKIFPMMTPFLKNNHNLTRITVEDCLLGDKNIRQLSLAMGDCSKLLKHFDIINSHMGDGQLVDLITILSKYPQLKVLGLERLAGMRIGRNECTALASLLSCTTTQLKALNLKSCYPNSIDDEGLETLTNALAIGHGLRYLYLTWNRSITIRGWKRLSTLLEMPGCKLETIDMGSNNIGDDVTQLFANALSSNSTLKKLNLKRNYGITHDGWASFEKLLCDTSSLNNIYLSNHTLEKVGGMNESTEASACFELNRLNRSTVKFRTKEQIAMIKILRNHSHFDMQSFFEWEIKVLPLMITWFEKAATCSKTNFDTKKVKKMKLSVTYDFIREFPMLYIEPMARKEVVECSALEKQLQQGDELEEIRQRKARALKRL